MRACAKKWREYGVRQSIAFAGYDDPFQLHVVLSGWVDKVVDRVIVWIGSVKYFTTPLGAVEDTSTYKIHDPS